MENKLLWHYKSPDISEYENACNQINSDDVLEWDDSIIIYILLIK